MGGLVDPRTDETMAAQGMQRHLIENFHRGEHRSA